MQLKQCITDIIVPFFQKWIIKFWTSFYRFSIQMLRINNYFQNCTSTFIQRNNRGLQPWYILTARLFFLLPFHFQLHSVWLITSSLSRFYKFDPQEIYRSVLWLTTINKTTTLSTQIWFVLLPKITRVFHFPYFLESVRLM